MKKEIDEMINKYLNNELNAAEIKELNELMRGDKEVLASIRAYKFIEDAVKDIEIGEAPVGIMEKIMQSLSKFEGIYSESRKFFTKVMAGFAAVTVGVFGYAVYYSASTETDSKSFQRWFEEASKPVNSFFGETSAFINSVFGNANVTLIGGILAVVLFISGVLMLESHKEFKTKLKDFTG